MGYDQQYLPGPQPCHFQIRQFSSTDAPYLQDRPFRCGVTTQLAASPSSPICPVRALRTLFNRFPREPASPPPTFLATPSGKMRRSLRRQIVSHVKKSNSSVVEKATLSTSTSTKSIKPNMSASYSISTLSSTTSHRENSSLLWSQSRSASPSGSAGLTTHPNVAAAVLHL